MNDSYQPTYILLPRASRLQRPVHVQLPRPGRLGRSLHAQPLDRVLDLWDSVGEHVQVVVADRVLLRLLNFLQLLEVQRGHPLHAHPGDDLVLHPVALDYVVVFRLLLDGRVLRPAVEGGPSPVGRPKTLPCLTLQRLPLLHAGPHRPAGPLQQHPHGLAVRRHLVLDAFADLGGPHGAETGLEVPADLPIDLVAICIAGLFTLFEEPDELLLVYHHHFRHKRDVLHRFSHDNKSDKPHETHPPSPTHQLLAPYYNAMSRSQAWFHCDEDCIHATVHYEFLLSVFLSAITVLVSAFHIYMHLQNFNNPFFQSKIIVILIMAPFYCITSLGSFVWPHLEIYFTLTRDSYEALLLFTFFYLMFSYLAYDRQKDTMEDIKVYKIMVRYEREVHHFWPFHYCQKAYQLTHWKKAKYFTYRCKKYVLQFLVVKLATTLLMYLVYPNEEKHELDDNYESDNRTYEIVSGVVGWVIAISASYSLYYLVLFYHALRQPLHPYSALLKFLTIKITIFFTFWQRICLIMFQDQILSGFDENAPSYNSRQIISSLQNTLICLEMMIMAIAGGLAYNYQSYMSEAAHNKGSFLYVLKDTIRAFKNDFRLIKPKRFGFESTHNTEIQLRDLKHANRKSVFCERKQRSSIEDSLDPDYLIH